MRSGLRTATTALLIMSANFGLAAPKEIRKPPMGDDLSVEVMRGGAVSVTLKAYEGRNNPLAYDIGSEPRFGELSDFRQADPNRQGFASVVYTHGDDEDSRADEFTFYARALSGGGKSRPIRVKIRVIDSPPRLAAPSRIDFTAVAGGNDARVIGLTNAGGKILEGRLEPAEPFSVAGDGYFRLGRSQSTTATLRFSPRSMSAVAQQKLLGTIVLNGEAEEPFAAEAVPNELPPDDEGAREGKIVVSNLSPSDLDLSVSVQPEGVAEVPGKVRLAEGKTAEIPLRIGGEKKGGELPLQVEVSNAFYTRTLSVTALPVPPKLEVATQNLDFREKSEAELHVRNSGGIPGRFLLEMPDGIRPVERAESFSVPPDGEIQVRLEIVDARKRADGEFVIVDLGKGGRRRVPVFVTPPPEEKPARTPKPKPTPTPTPLPIWLLNQDVKLKAEPGKPACVLWAPNKPGWTNASLEVDDGTGARAYEPAPRSESWWSACKAWFPNRMVAAKHWLANIFKRRTQVPGEAEETNDDENPWPSLEIAEQDLSEKTLTWHISAENIANGNRTPVSDDFHIDTAKNALVPLQAAPTLTASDQPPCKLLDGRVAAEKTGAKLWLVVEANPKVTSYRLECSGATEGNATILETFTTQLESVSATSVLASVEGLRPNTLTSWKLVPLVGQSPLPPTRDFKVLTLPPTPFPWRGFFFWTTCALLVFVLWLRWKMNRSA